MHRSDGAARPRSRAWLLRAVAVLVVAATVPLAGTPTPDLRPASTTDPLPPTNVVAASADRALAVSWRAPSEAFVTGYQVFVDGDLAASPTGTSATVGNLVNGQTYVVTVRTVTSFLGTFEGTTTSPPVDGVPRDALAPGPPTGVTAVRGDGRVDLTWTPNSADTDVDGYRVLRDGAPVTGLLTGPGTSGWPDTTVVNDVPYAYAVQTHDTSGNWSLPSAPAVTATPTDLTPPAVPAGLLGGRGDGEAGLAWTPNGESDLAGYVLFRDGQEIVTVADTDHLDPGLTNDRTYGYTLLAVDTHGNRSAQSAPVLVTPTDLTPPDAPTGLVAVRGDGRVDLTWSANPEPDLARYRLMRDGVEIALVTGTGHADVGLTNDIAYRYTLAAIDTHGNHSLSTSPAVATPTDLGAPAAPVGLAADPGDGQVTLSWTANAEPDVATYRVLRDGVEVAAVAGPGHVDTGLANGTTYAYALVAVDGHGNTSPVSASVPAIPADTTPPSAPTGLAAVPGDGGVVLSWTANPEPDVTGYRVLRDGGTVATVAGTSYADSGLTNDTAYAYALVAVDAGGNVSPRSAPVTATPTDATPPAVPTGLVVTRVSGRSVLDWTANPEPDLATYRVLRDGAEIATVTGTAYTDNQASGPPRSYSLVAVDTRGNRSAASEPMSSRSDVTPPDAPTGLAAVRGDSRVSLSWAANGENDLATYRVLRDGVEIATVTGRSHVDTGLTNDVAYRYTLVAVDDSDNRSAESAPVTATPTDLTPPAVPAGLAADAGERQVTLTWTASGEPDLASYRLLRDGVEIATVAGTTYTDPGRTNDVEYAYSLVAVDTHGNRSAASAAVPATPRDLPPAPPTDVVATTGDRRAVLSWTAPADPDVVGYRVLAQDGSTVATVAAPATRATVTGLTNGTSYRFTVVAVDAGGNVSAPTPAATVLPVSPTVPTVGAGESGGVAASTDGRFVVVGTRAQREASDTNTAYELYLIDRTAGTARRIAPLPASSASTTDPTNTAAPVISDDGRYVVLATTAALLPGDTNGQYDVYRRDLSTGTWALVSAPAAGAASAATPGTLLQTGSSVYATSPALAVSADGDLVVFYSARSDLVAGDTNGLVDVFAKRLSTGVVTRVSTTTAGANLGAATGPALALTPDGRFVVFPAAVPGGAAVLYRKTLSGAGAGELVVVSSAGTGGTAVQAGVFRDTGDVAVSDDGRYVAFVTGNRVTTTTPGAISPAGLAYRKDLVTGGILALGSGQQTVWEHRVELDPTGRYAFFETSSAQLPADTNGHSDHYRRDLDGGVAGPLVLVTSDADGAPTAGPIGSVAPSEYGRLFAAAGDRVLVLTAQALVSADTNRVRDLYSKDLVSGVAGSPVG